VLHTVVDCHLPFAICYLPSAICLLEVRTMGTLILPDFLIDLPGEAPKERWGVRVEAEQIVEVAPNAELRQAHPEDEAVEAIGQTLSPGFVDAHTHLYGVLAHGIPLHKAPSSFWPFLTDFWWPLVEDRLDHEMICAATDLNCAQMLRGGTTSFYDITEAPNALPRCLHVQAEVVRKRGIRGILSFEATERVSKANGQLGLEENLEFIRASRRQTPASSFELPVSSLVSGLMCYHTTFTCSAEFIRQAFEMAAGEGALVHMHASEGTYEPENALRHFGGRTFEYYDRLGVAGPNMQASQCVQITPAEVEIIAQRGVHVTHMPLSNCEVGGGIAPVPDLVAAGVTVGLGSDGYITDMFEVMRGAFLIHKARRQDPRVMPAGLVWQLATEGGARALGLEKVGRLLPGWQADLQLIDSILPTPVGAWNLYDQLLLYRSRRDVRAVMVAGQWRVRGGEVQELDENSVRARAHEAARRLWQM
jgi:5-methylthioadenosine/S-adenosylhomocysteine deaminase